MGQKSTRPPLVSFVTWNRMGLTIRNLSALLKTTDDFELHITDSNSGDDTWEYIMSLEDNRIRSRTRLNSNKGPIYAVNYTLSKRVKDQYFIALDSDVNIHTADWVGRFMEVFDVFPNVGLLGAVSREYYKRYRMPLIERKKDDVYYWQITKGFIEGCCQCFRPELLNLLGYWCEECCMGDVEICGRICGYTGYKAGYLPAIEIDLLQQVPCGSCDGKQWCSLIGGDRNCFEVRSKKYRNPQFRGLYGWKYKKCLEDMAGGRRSVFRASVHDAKSLEKVAYNKHMSEENFRFYEVNSN